MDYGVDENSYIEYSSNNSGGSWWLSDKDWEALEEAGWVVNWVKDDPYMSKYANEDGKWLGAKATSAKRYGVPMELAMAEFVMITGQSPYDDGCSCCGQPHNFYAYDKDGEMIW
jgi:hypothetical protein